MYADDLILLSPSVIGLQDIRRRIFRHNRYESVKDVQYSCNELPLELLYGLLRRKFLPYVSHIPVTLRTLFNFQRHVLCEMSTKYGHAISVRGMKRVSFQNICTVKKLELTFISFVCL